MHNFLNFVLHDCILIFVAEQVYLMPQVTNVEKKEDTANLKPESLGKNCFSKTLNPKP